MLENRRNTMENKETGEQIENNDYYRMEMEKIKNPFIQCQHCYCGKININNQPHRVCCMCGHRQLVNPITY
jgi:rRNA maturation endonuclease Nob1